MDKSGNSVKLPALKKSDRANSRASIIRANSVTTDEQIDKCLNYAISSSNYDHKSSVNLKEIENNLFDCYEVYDFKGLKIKTCSSKDELKNLKGFFVVKCYSQGIYLKTIKLSRL